MVVKKDDSDSRALEDPFVQLGAEARQPVFVGNHNLRDKAFLRGDQKPREAAPAVLEAGAHVLVDFVVGVAVLQRLDLAGEVVFLLVRRHAGVDSPVGFGLLLLLRFRFAEVRRVGGLGDSVVGNWRAGHEGVELRDAVASVATRGKGAGEFSIDSPLGERRETSSQVASSLRSLED